MKNKQKNKIHYVNGKLCLSYTCSNCGKAVELQLVSYPKGSTYTCQCGGKLTITFNENEMIAQLREQAKNTLKKGLKKFS